MTIDAPISTPVVDRLQATGYWNPLWDQLFEWDPEWTEQFVTMGTMSNRDGILSPKFVELLSIGIDASTTHLYAPGIRRHIRAALEIGVTRQEILAVLQLVSVLGIHSCNLGVPILAEELKAFEAESGQPTPMTKERQ